MIPKIIHYCWFGHNPKSGLINECIASWKKHMPDYKIMEWNEDTFDISSVNYTLQAYNSQKWAFVSDYVRLYAIYHFGGIYLDTDVEILKPFESEFLENEAFTGFESNDSPITAVMGASKGNQIIGELLNYYSTVNFVNKDGSYNMKTNTTIITEYLISHGIRPNGKKQSVNHFMIYPQITFCPNNLSRIWNCPSNKSYSIHHFDQSWLSEKKDNTTLIARIRRYIVGFLRNIVGTQRLASLKRHKLIK